MIKKYMSAIFSVIAALVLQFMPVSYAQAGGCTLSNSSTINVIVNEQIYLTPSASAPSVNNVLYSRSFPTVGITFTCTSSTAWQSAYSRAYTATTESRIYQTEIQGIGIRIKWPVSLSDSYYLPTASVICQTSSCTIAADNLTLEFIHIGTVVAGEQIIPAGEIANAYFLNDNGTPRFMTVTLGADVIIAPRTCAIYPSQNHIDLGSYDLASLSSRRAGNLVDFYLHISCPVSSIVSLTFESANYIFSSGAGDIGASLDSVPGLSVRVLISTLSASLYSAITLETRAYSFRNVLERSIPMRAQLYISDSALFESSGGAGTVNSGLIYTMSMR